MTKQPRDSKGRFIAAPKASVPAVRASSPPTFRSSWKYFAAIVGFAIVWHYAWAFVVVAGIIAAPLLLLAWLEPRHPRTASIVAAAISGFISGLCGSSGYYRRRWWW